MVVDTKAIKSMLIKSARIDNNVQLVELLKNGTCSLLDVSEFMDSKTYYEYHISIGLIEYKQLKNPELIEDAILSEIKRYNQSNDYEFVAVKILIKNEILLDWDAIYPLSKQDVLNSIKLEKDLLVKAATDTRIDDIEKEYITNHALLVKLLSRLEYDPPIKFSSLWDWYNFYKNKFPKWAQRRDWVNDSYSKLIEIIKQSDSSMYMTINCLTGWEKVDNMYKKMQSEMLEAKDTFAYQKVGLAARDLLIFLGREIYKPELHGVEYEGVKIGKDDDTRMINAYINYQLKGSNNDDKRKFVKTITNLADNLTHKLDNGKKIDAEMCLESITSLLRIIKAIERNIK
ncbi:MAG: hypothetical protein IJ538_03745 [Clostridia bacterium]|nr:hypothetical protein [Clostridia bacterium]